MVDKEKFAYELRMLANELQKLANLVEDFGTQRGSELWAETGPTYRAIMVQGNIHADIKIGA